MTWEVGSGFVTGFGSLAQGARKILVSMEKEFKAGHRRDLSQSRFINAKQAWSQRSYAGCPKTLSLSKPLFSTMRFPNSLPFS
jgi:hypothetical protein